MPVPDAHVSRIWASAHPGGSVLTVARGRPGAVRVPSGATAGVPHGEPDGWDS